MWEEEAAVAGRSQPHAEGGSARLEAAVCNEL